jgi:hypothetical protein
MAKKVDLKNKQTYVITDCNVNLKFMHDVAYQKQVLKQRREKKVKPKPKKKKNTKRKQKKLTEHDRIVNAFKLLNINFCYICHNILPNTVKYVDS